MAMLEPGGRWLLDNPSTGSLLVARSGEGDQVSITAVDADPVFVPLALYKMLLQMCGYLVMQREDVAAHTAASLTPQPGTEAP